MSAEHMNKMSEEMTADMAWNCLRGMSMEMTAKDMSSLALVAARLAPGTIVSVPFLPNQSDADRVEAAAAIRKCNFSPMPHIAARRLASHKALETLLEQWATRARVDRLLVLAGDCAKPEGPFTDALAVIKTGLLGQYGIRHVAISGYPEGHPKISVQRLAQAMRDKLSALAELGIAAEITTQFSFSAEPVLAWLAQLRAGGINVPVRLGIPGPASLRTLLRYAALCGVCASASVLARYGFSLPRLMSNTGPDRIVSGLAESLTQSQHGKVFAHFYPFGGMDDMLSWIDWRSFVHSSALRGRVQ